MRHPIITAAIMVFVLSACATNGGPSSAIADSVVEVDTPDQRVVRAGGFAVIACELAVDRVFRGDAEDAPSVLFFCQRLDNAMADIRKAKGLWVNADLFDAKRLVVIAAGEQGKKRAISLLANLGFRDALKGLAKGLKAVAMLRDVSYIVDAIQNDRLTTKEAWAGIEGRMKRNMNRLKPLVKVKLL